MSEPYHGPYREDVWPDDRSGLVHAERAHAAGVVEPPVELPTFDVKVTVKFHGPEQSAKDLAEGLSQLALHWSGQAPRNGGVLSVSSAVIER